MFQDNIIDAESRVLRLSAVQPIVWRREVVSIDVAVGVNENFFFQWLFEEIFSLLVTNVWILDLSLRLWTIFRGALSRVSLDNLAAKESVRLRVRIDSLWIRRIFAFLANNHAVRKWIEQVFKLLLPLFVYLRLNKEICKVSEVTVEANFLNDDDCYPKKRNQVFFFNVAHGLSMPWNHVAKDEQGHNSEQ